MPASSTTSGTKNWNPSVAEAVISAYGRCGVKRASFTPEHMIDARMEANLLLAEWSNVQPHLWKIDETPFEVPLEEGIADYELPGETLLALDVYISSPVTNDRVLYPINRSDYATYPNKDQEGVPSVYWFNRQYVPVITVYLRPDQNGPYTLKIYRVTRFDDAIPRRNETPDVTYRFLPAFIAGLAARLSETYAPDRYDALEKRHQDRFNTANTEDKEDGPLSIYPGLSPYYNP